MTERKVAVVSIGSNSLIKNPARRTIEDQFAATREICYPMADMIESGWDLVIGYGNGPQLDYMLLRSELAHRVDGLHEVPLDTLIADTQGAIGYWLQQNLQNILYARRIKKTVVTIITQTVVDPQDPAFRNPTRPIGGFLNEVEARRRQAEMGWKAIEDPQKGWRSAVPGPSPKRIVELEAIKNLISTGTIVISAGGGGIPVVETGSGTIESVSALINKDSTCGLLAQCLHADLFLIFSTVQKLARNYGIPEVEWIDKMTLSQAKKCLSESNQFSGSIISKLKAIIAFLRSGGERAIITHPSNVMQALRGESGTQFIPDR